MWRKGNPLILSMRMQIVAITVENSMESHQKAKSSVVIWSNNPTPGYAATAAKSLQSCPTLCDPIDGSPLGSPVPGILQARTLEWVAISFSNAWKWKVKVKSLSHVRPSVTPWTAAYQAPPFIGFSRQRVLEWGAIAPPTPGHTSRQN